jgi:hypothetical protein
MVNISSLTAVVATGAADSVGRADIEFVETYQDRGREYVNKKK